VTAMRASSNASLPAVAATLLCAAAAAQNPVRNMSIGYVYPAGGRRGTTVQVTVGGQGLLGVHAAHLSGTGVRAKVVGTPSPPRPDEISKDRDELRALANRKLEAMRLRSRPADGKPQPAWTEEDEDRLMEVAEKVSAFARARDVPALATRVTLEVVIAASAAPGRRELRLEGPLGLSNPLVFQIGDLPEIAEPPLQARDVMATVGEQRFAQWRRFAPRPDSALRLKLPTVVNGQIGPGEQDRFVFSARKGQRIVVAAVARELLPYVADAVPGWCDPVIRIADADGRELACADHWRFHPDPALCFEVPEDGEYTLEIADCLFRGREDFVYRLTVGERPFVTDIFPLGGRAGTATPIAVQGWNLPAAAVTVPATLSPGCHPLAACGLPWLGAPALRFAADSLPNALENSLPEDSRGGRRVLLPVWIDGRIGRPGEADVYVFEGRAGEKIAMEVQARRLGSPLDSHLRLTDAAGRTLASNDDFTDRGAGLVTHQADSFLLATLPSNGTYRVCLSDTQGKAGNAHAYRLRLGEPRPDFELRVSPSVVNLRRGTAQTVTLHALRRDGFDGEIVVSLKDAPDGFALGGNRIPPGVDQIRMTLAAPTDGATGPVPMQFRGEATVAGRRVVREAAPAEDMMQAFAWRFLVPAESFSAYVMPGRGRAFPWPAIEKPVRIPVGGTATVSLRMPLKTPRGDLGLELSDPPAGVSLARAVERGWQTDLVLQAAADAKPGLQGNLIVDVSLTPSAPADGAAPRRFASAPAGGGKAVSATNAAERTQAPAPAAPRRVPIGTLPAIPFEVVGR